MMSQFMDGLVSVIVPAYNSEMFLSQSLVSVLEQDYQSLEIFVIDDASTDGTVGVAHEAARADRRIQIVPLKRNRGAAFARNQGLERARGQYVAFLDADDVWDRRKISLQVEFMRSSQVPMSFTAYRLCNAQGEFLGRVVDRKSPSVVDYKDMLAKKATIGCSTVVVDVSVVGALKMPMMRTGQDYALWLDILKRGFTAHRLDEILVDYRIVPGSISRNKFNKARRQWKIYREVERIGVLRSAWYFTNYALRAVVRR